MMGPSSDQELVRPTQLAQALGLLGNATRPARPVCGGTDLMVQAASDAGDGPLWLDVSRLEELRGISSEGRWLRVGAGECFARLRQHPLIVEHAPLLAQCAAQLGARAIQERASIGGNLANASPAADSAPALIAHGAELELLSLEGSRRLPVEAFFLAYRHTALRHGELIAAVWIPLTRAQVVWYRKVGTRRAQAITKVALAASGHWEQERLHSRIGMASVAPVPFKCHQTEAWLREHAGQAGWMEAAAACLRAEISPIDDLRSTAAYRRQVAGNLLMAWLRRMEASR